MSDKEQFFAFCDHRNDIPLFLQAWWMECVSCGNEWDVILKKNGDSEIVAFLPYMLTKKLGHRMVIQPNLSQTNGIWIDANHISEEKDIIRYFLNELEKLHLDWYLQNYSFHYLNRLNHFSQNGYQVTSRRTFIIPNLQKEESQLFEAIESSQRRQIRKAIKNGISTKVSSDISQFLHFRNHCLNSRGETNHNSVEVENRLIQEAIKRGAGTLLYACDKDGVPLATLFLVWDKETAYYLIPAYDYLRKDSGASSFLVWKAICHARQMGLRVFDFEGGNDNSIGRFYAQFGSTSLSYPMVERITSPLLRLYNWWRKR